MTGIRRRIEVGDARGASERLRSWCMPLSGIRLYRDPQSGFTDALTAIDVLEKMQPAGRSSSSPVAGSLRLTHACGFGRR